MMGKKKLSEIKAQLEALSAHPPGKPPKAQAPTRDTKRIVQTLEALCAELERAAKKTRKPKGRQRPVKR
jgi:hypothetical protein